MSETTDSQPQAPPGHTSAIPEIRDPHIPLVSIEIGARPAARITRVTKIGRLTQLLATHPVEFYDRVRAIAETRARHRHPTLARYAPINWEDLTHQLRAGFPDELSWTSDDPGY